MFADIQAAIQVEQRMSRSRGTMRDYLNKTCASYNKMTSIKKHRIDGARKSLLYNLCLSLIGGQLVLFFPFNFGQENNLSCTWVELSRGSFLYHHDGLIKGCDPPKTSWTWCTATTIPILISNQAWFRKHVFQGFFLGCWDLSTWARIAVGDIGPRVLGAWVNRASRMPTVSWERDVQ